MGSRRLSASTLALTAAITVTAPAWRLAAQPQEAPAPVFRVFLKDGSSLATYGEFVRIGDRVAFSIPLGQGSGLPRLQAASVSADDVDWPATERYAASLRAERYFATRAPVDFDALADAMQKLLQELAKTDDVKMKLAIAERIRNALAAWPAEHHGYRTEEVRRMLALADDVVSELQTTKGGEEFSLALVAIPESPPHVPLLPAPTLQESIEQALRLAAYAPSPAERILLLEAGRMALESDSGNLPSQWRDKTLRNIVRAIEVEQKTTRNYAQLRDRALARLGRLTENGDVRGIERLIEDVRRRDERLGRQRPDMTAALVATLDRRLGEVRRTRDERERSAAQTKAMAQYLRAIDKPLDESSAVTADLVAIRAGGLLQPSRVDDLNARLARLTGRLREVAVPAEAAGTHAALTSAVTLAGHAVVLRAAGPGPDPVQSMRDASAAAAGALLLFERARTEAAALSARSDDRPVKP